MSPTFEDKDASKALANGRLFTARSIAVASAIGSLLAGALFLAFNYARVGDPRRAIASLVGGTTLLMLLGNAVALLFPDTEQTPLAPMTLIPIQTLAAYWGASVLQGPLLNHHRASGGAFFSDTRAAVLSCVVAAVGAALIALTLWALGAPAT